MLREQKTTQKTLFEDSGRKPYRDFELYNKLCRYSGRDFKPEQGPKKMLLHTTAGVYTLIVDDEKIYFEGAVTNG